jgi:hypothetical protein
MNTFLQSVRTVLWSFIGLGGGRANAEARAENFSLLAVVGVAVVGVLLLICALAFMAHLATS